MNTTYDFIKNKAVRLGQKAARRMNVDPKNARPGELLLFAKLDPAESEYRLSLSHDDASKILPFAKGLKDRNGFAAAGMAIGILPAPIINATEYADAASILHHADAFVFDGAATADLTEAQALASLYTSGTHTLKTNQGIRIDNEPNVGFRRVQQTQGAATSENEFDGSEVKPFGALIRFAKLRIDYLSGSHTAALGFRPMADT